MKDGLGEMRRASGHQGITEMLKSPMRSLQMLLIRADLSDTGDLTG